ncbi:MAG: mechanosensitive ion channel family protein [Deltaproteobacteria bacterium]|nr:mechanosensitive ion channel family protein [Deltaproteobacteria bacterium]
MVDLHLPPFLASLVTPDQLLMYFKATVILLGGLLLLILVRLSLKKLLSKKLEAQHALVIRRIASYIILGISIAWALGELGFSITVLLGAAGVFTVAIGFAAQTSASNLISGFFLMGEKPFVIGDMIEVDGVTGEVLSVDLLSVKLRTFDNLFVRIPNESIIKSKVTTLTRFPIRRLDMSIGVAYKEALERVRDILFEVARKNPLCLENPKPLFIFQAYGASSLDLQFSVWSQREKYLELKNTMFMEVKSAFDKEGIEIPFPHLSIYAGSTTEAIPVTILQKDLS